VRTYLKKKKNPSQQRAGGVAQGEDPEFKPQYCKKKKKVKWVCWYMSMIPATWVTIARGLRSNASPVKTLPENN
jgi:hypothetical protein